MSAVEELTKAIELDSNFASAYYYRGCALNKGFASDGMDTITRDFEKCIALAPDSNFWEAYFYLASLVYEYYDDEKALAYYNKAIYSNPTNYILYCQRGYLRERMRNIDGAMDDYYKSISLNNKAYQALYNKYHLEETLGNLKEALITINQLLSFEKQDANIYFDKAFILCELGQKKNAQDAFEIYNRLKDPKIQRFELDENACKVK